jgi:hypothetical protein
MGDVNSLTRRDTVDRGTGRRGSGFAAVLRKACFTAVVALTLLLSVNAAGDSLLRREKSTKSQQHLQSKATDPAPLDPAYDTAFQMLAKYTPAALPAVGVVRRIVSDDGRKNLIRAIEFFHKGQLTGCSEVQFTREVMVLFDDKTQAAAIILESMVKKIAFFAFRGVLMSRTINPDFTNLDFVPQAWKVQGAGGKEQCGVIHRTLGENYEGLQGEIRNFVRSYASKGYRMLFTGHAAGGSMAALAALDVKVEFDLKPKQLTVITFAAPKLGDQNFVECYTKHGLWDRTLRYSIATDPLVRLPKQLLPIGHKVRVPCGNTLTFCHRMRDYVSEIVYLPAYNRFNNGLCFSDQNRPVPPSRDPVPSKDQLEEKKKQLADIEKALSDGPKTQKDLASMALAPPLLEDPFRVNGVGAFSSYVSPNLAVVHNAIHEPQVAEGEQTKEAKEQAKKPIPTTGVDLQTSLGSEYAQEPISVKSIAGETEKAEEESIQ